MRFADGGDAKVTPPSAGRLAPPELSNRRRQEIISVASPAYSHLDNSAPCAHEDANVVQGGHAVEDHRGRNGAGNPGRG